MNIDHIVNKILNEITNTYSRGGYDYPLQNKILKFKKTNLDPFNVEVNLGDNPEDEIKKNNLSEDLAVWFGKKKKPKGSSQPKGPWVDICRKVGGKHPPCGRKDADKGSYPKCRAAGVAGKMSDSEKRNACQQKRAIERKDTQIGKGQKPNWVSHKKKKKKTNENMKTRIINLNENDLMRIVKRVINESDDPIIIPAGQIIKLECKNIKGGIVMIDGRILPGRTINANRGRNEWIVDPTGMTNKKVEVYIEPEEFIHKFTVESTGGVPEHLATPHDKENFSVYIEPLTEDMAKVIDGTPGSKVLTHFKKNIPFEENTGRYYCKYIEGSEGISNILESEGVKIA